MDNESSTWAHLKAAVVITESSIYLFEGFSYHFGASWKYGPLHNRSVAHPFLLAAFHSKFIGEQKHSASFPFLGPLSMNL